MGSMGSGLAFSELRKILRLSSELRDLPRGSRDQKEHALRGLCSLIGAQLGIWLELRDAGRGRLLLRDTIDLGWGTERERRMFVAYLDAQPTAIDPTHAPLTERMGDSNHVTVMRREVLADRAWYRSPHVQDFRRAGGVDDFIYAGRRIGTDEMRGLSLHRPWGDRPFQARDVAVIDAFTRESLWIHEPTALDRITATLSPRQREVLGALLRGLAEKQIADELGLSSHTVHDYVKVLYRRLGVRSRGELLARFVHSR